MNLAYLIFSLVTAFFLGRTSPRGHRLIVTICAFWLLGGSIIHESSMSLPGDMQIKRLIFFLLAGYALYMIAKRVHVPAGGVRLPFEKYIYLFYVAMIAVLVYHFVTRTLTFKELLGPVQGMLTVLIFYLILRHHASVDGVKIILKTWMIAAVISSGVALVQFFVASDFLRVGYFRGAYGGQIRAFGVFNAEYLNSYFLTGAIIITLVFLRSLRIKVLLTGLFLTAIALSFHRMSWAVALFIICLYIVLVQGGKVWMYAIIGGTVAFLLYVVATEFVPLIYQFEQSTVFRTRLTQDTMSERFRFYNMVFERFDKIYLLGAGSVKSSIYYYGMLSAGAGVEWAREGRGGIHNLYLETLFFYGLPVLLLFTGMIAAIMTYFYRLFKRVDKVYLAMFLFFVMYCLMNLTNGFPLYGDFGVIFGIALGCGAVAARTEAGKTGRMETAVA